jgi:membrane-bound lytic murein transglycosylase
MAKANRASTHKSGASPTNNNNTRKSNTNSSANMNEPKVDAVKKPVEQVAPASTSAPTSTDRTNTSKGRQAGKGNRPVVGGAAVAGAKSTQPKVITSNNPQQQQAESYNRVMRRRMQKMGTGPYNDSASTMQEQRKKRIERKKQRSEELRQKVTRGPRPNLSLGRRNTIFLISVAVIIVAIIVLAIIINHPFR